MENSRKELEAFKTFASKTAANHQEELDTRYRERPVELSVVKQAYQEHKLILEKELNDKIEALVNLNDQKDVKQLLVKIKDSVVSNFYNRVEKS